MEPREELLPPSAGRSEADPTPGGTSRRSLTRGALAALAGVAALGASSAQAQSTKRKLGCIGERIDIVDSIQRLIDAPVGAARRVALVLGYSVLNDGGGGFFLWDPSGTQAADGGTVFRSTVSPTGRWIRLEL